MKKITYSLTFGIIGTSENLRSIFLEYFDNLNMNSNKPENLLNHNKFFILYQKIPMKITILQDSDIDSFSSTYMEGVKLDVVILLVDMHDKESLESFHHKSLKKFEEYNEFKGIDMLVGTTLEANSNNTLNSNKELSIEQSELIKKAEYLDVLYCFEIQNAKNDINDLFSEVFDFFLFKFQTTSPEIFGHAKLYGTTLKEKLENH